MPFVWGVDWGNRWPRPGEPLTHIHLDECDIPRDPSELIAIAKRGELSGKEQVEIGYALELWHEMAIKAERAIHRLTKNT